MLFSVNTFVLHTFGNATAVRCQYDVHANTRGQLHTHMWPLRVRSWLVGTAMPPTARGFNH